MSAFGYCEHCGAPRASAIVSTPDGKQPHAVGLVCSADPSHGPDGVTGGELGTLGDDERCNRCGGENVVWSAPSPLWNLVMRGTDIDGDPKWGDLVCIRCFIVLAEKAGARGRWRVSADPEPEGLVKVTPSGRVWDDAKWLWIEPQRPCTDPECAVDAALRGNPDEYDRLDLRVQWTLGYVTGTVVTIAIVALAVILL